LALRHFHRVEGRVKM